VDSFPGIDRTEVWYRTAQDGLIHLQTAIHSTKKRLISELTDEEIFGMSNAEWQEYYKSRSEEHEIFACLALLASCEGAIRRDLDWRVTTQRRHHVELRRFATGQHASIVRILDRWRNIIGPSSNAYRPLQRLTALYKGRNDLAHGGATIGQFVFIKILESLQDIERRWREEVADFRGF
jgi:hypothetical protein